MENKEISIKIIAKIHNDFVSKFGIPRQSMIKNESISEIVFEKEFNDENAVRGIEGYSHLWLIWLFSENDGKWSPTVRPPRLGGNKRVGVFATRSPYRPNPIGISCVELVKVEKTKDRGIVLYVKGADLMNDTPIVDIKPYLSFSDSVPDSLNGFAENVKEDILTVSFENGIKEKFDEAFLTDLSNLLSQDPRPSYIDDESRIYGMNYGEYEVKFSVSGSDLTVISIEK